MIGTPTTMDRETYEISVLHAFLIGAFIQGVIDADTFRTLASKVHMFAYEGGVA